MAKRHLIVVYHEDCIDGMASAWTLQQKWGKDEGTAISYVAYAHSYPEKAEKNILKALKAGSELYFVDVAPRGTLLDKLLAASPQPKTKNVTILDHHLTAAKNLACYKPPADPVALNVHIDEKYPSASHMIWGIFFPGLKPPAFLDMINKMDLGKDLSTEEDFAAAAFIDSKSITSLKAAFNSCSALSRMTHQEMSTAGSSLLDALKDDIAKLDDNVAYADLRILPDTAPVRVPVVNADVHHFGRGITNYLNKLGEQSGAGIALAWHVNTKGGVNVSIRSTSVDASKVAEYLCKTMGLTGGGHATSAAVYFPSVQSFQKHVVLRPERPRPKKPAPPQL